MQLQGTTYLQLDFYHACYTPCLVWLSQVYRVLHCEWGRRVPAKDGPLPNRLLPLEDFPGKITKVREQAEPSYHEGFFLPRVRAFASRARDANSARLFQAPVEVRRACIPIC